MLDLDPLATGLLLICTGKMTKKISEIQALIKPIWNYHSGCNHPSYDLETEIDQNFPIDHITKNQIIQLKKFEGEIINTLLFSLLSKKRQAAIWVCEWKKIRIEARKVTLHEFDLLKSIPCSTFTLVF